jgi:hypothetical protein
MVERVGFELAAEYLRQLGRAPAEDLIVEAARLHFNSAASPQHREMAMAKRWYSSIVGVLGGHLALTYLGDCWTCSCNITASRWCLFLRHSPPSAILSTVSSY